MDVALGSLKEPANSLWINMQDYAISKGPLVAALHEFCLVFVFSLSVSDRVLTGLSFLLQTGTMRLSVMSLCWTLCPGLCWQPY